MLRTLGAVFLGLIGFGAAIGGGFLSHYLLEADGTGPNPNARTEQVAEAPREGAPAQLPTAAPAGIRPLSEEANLQSVPVEHRRVDHSIRLAGGGGGPDAVGNDDPRPVISVVNGRTVSDKMAAVVHNNSNHQVTLTIVAVGVKSGNVQVVAKRTVDEAGNPVQPPKQVESSKFEAPKFISSESTAVFNGNGFQNGTYEIQVIHDPDGAASTSEIVNVVVIQPKIAATRAVDLGAAAKDLGPVLQDQGPLVPVVAQIVPELGDDVVEFVVGRKQKNGEQLLVLDLAVPKNPKFTIDEIGDYEIRATVNWRREDGQEEKLAIQRSLQVVHTGPKYAGSVTSVAQLSRDDKNKDVEFETGDPQGEILLFSDTFVADVTVSQDDRRVAFRDAAGNFVPETTQPSPAGPRAIQLAAGELEPGVHDLQLVDVWLGQPLDSITVIVPEAPSPLAQPQITHFGRGVTSEFESVTGSTPPKVYGGFIKLEGVGAPPKGSLEFFVFKGPPSGPFVREPNVVVTNGEVETPGAWSRSLNWPHFDGGGIAFVVSRFGKQHNFSAPFKFETDLGTIPIRNKPEVAKITTIDATKEFSQSEDDAVFRGRHSDIKITGTDTVPEGAHVVVFDVATNHIVSELGESVPAESAAWGVIVRGIDGARRLQAAFAIGNSVGPKSDIVTVEINTNGPRVTGVIPPNFGTAPGVQKLRITFNGENQLHTKSAELEANYELYGSKGSGNFDRIATDAIVPTRADFEPAKNSVVLTFNADKEVLPDIYQLIIRGRDPSNPALDNGLRDVYGNFLEGLEGKPGTDFKTVLGKPDTGSESGDELFISRGISGATGEFIPFQEFTEPRDKPDGFNPSDKVISRVARLYYFRDAHRVTQILNRKAKSYNRQAVDVKTQLANKARTLADQSTDARRALERAAIRAAQDARRSEEALEDFQNSLATARRQRDSLSRQLRSIDDQIQQTKANKAQAEKDLDALNATMQDSNAIAAARQNVTTITRTLSSLETTHSRMASDLDDADSEVQLAERRVTAVLGEVQANRTMEIQATEKWDAAEATETRSREEQFRREVAAAHEDPDTYAPGVPNSDDPVEQVSISVIGEGLIQLRGPIKGVNIVRTMINQIDAPVGQVRVALHTVQVGGEHGDRMEKVVARIQRYIDHSRFLTSQSAQMLRNAVVSVASRRASEAAQLCPTGSQLDRDEKYLVNFFGSDFIAELRELDSEFLHTGNKVLSLHSMDTTSLSQALFLLALAKNDTRREILDEFQRLVRDKLPCDEQEYFMASGAELKFGCKKFKFFAPNARFVSFRGFFDAQLVGDNTLNPLQREFIRLAQIFKSRLVTEREWKQRVVERGLIEERIGNYAEELEAARKMEDAANAALREVQEMKAEQQQKLLSTFLAAVQTVDQGIVPPSAQTIFPKSLLDAFRAMKGKKESNETSKIEFQRQFNEYLKDQKNQIPVELNNRQFNIEIDTHNCPNKYSKWTIKVNEEDERVWLSAFGDAVDRYRQSAAFIDQFVLIHEEFRSEREDEQEWLDKLNGRINEHGLEDASKKVQNIFIVARGRRDLQMVVDHLHEGVERYKRSAIDLAAQTSEQSADIRAISNEWQTMRARILKSIAGGQLRQRLSTAMSSVDEGFNKLLDAQLKEQIAQALANDSRRPLDHKKFLDMLIDDVEEKFIELVEGTRAHTANIDNYIKRISTSLEDDFNTQFYHPAFREVRQTSRYWDVNFAQIETTSILTNNRMFAKVSPQATMEFDLPKRDIVINEAFQGALAAYSDYGALLGDPSFLALSKMYGGQPTSSSFNPGLPGTPVRDILPGLPSSTDENLLSQAATNQPAFGSQLEALIPDPAIYKFETGTGFEIRPVIQPDGQAVVFHLNYMYTTNVREPVRADEKHLGRVKRHFIDTDVQTGNYELREVSRYQVALKASRTSRGVPLLEDIPGLGMIFRPLPQAESSLQENLILAQSVIYPTLFDLMGLRWAPAVADLDTLRLREEEFVTRNRQRALGNQVFDYSSTQVDDFIRIPQQERRGDLYRVQETIPSIHPNGYHGPGMGRRDSSLQEGYSPHMIRPDSEFTPGSSRSAPFAPAIPHGAPLQIVPSELPTPTPGVDGGVSRRTRDVRGGRSTRSTLRTAPGKTRIVLGERAGRVRSTTSETQSKSNPALTQRSGASKRPSATTNEQGSNIRHTGHGQDSGDQNAFSSKRPRTLLPAPDSSPLAPRGKSSLYRLKWPFGKKQANSLIKKKANKGLPFKVDKIRYEEQPEDKSASKRRRFRLPSFRRSR